VKGLVGAGDGSTKPTVSVQLLGPFAIHAGGRTAGPWRRTSAKELLALVFLSPNRRVTREIASDTLFGHLAPQGAANAMYNALSSARGTLSALGHGAADVLVADRTSVYISPTAPIDVDLERHEKALETALRMTPGHARDIALLQALSVEGVLLEDDLYAEWSASRRQRLELARQDARLALARDRSRGFGRSGAKGVIEAWEAVFSHDLASEEAATALMRTYVAEGQRQLAARTYDRCRAGLGELGLEPSVALERAHHDALQEVVGVGPSRSTDLRRLESNLPASLSTFIGRQAEWADISSLVRSSSLVTITGTGGSGKTRLALEVAKGLLAGGEMGAFLVELAAVTDDMQVPAEVAAALGVREQTSRPLNEVLPEALSGQNLLVLMDNCEHVIGAAAEVVALLGRRCPRLHVLATSREPLGVESEHVYRLGPLSLPPADTFSLRELDGSDAVKLFADRGRAHDATFCLDDSSAGLVASVCRRLDGLPLAIELAAARLPSMSLAHLDERLDRRLRLLTGGPRTAQARQRTLRATIDWSYDLLSSSEQEALARLSVFAGSFDLEAAEAVCSTDTTDISDVADLLKSLVEKNLVVAERSSVLFRYLLLETVREYSHERLLAAGGEARQHQVREAHAQYYLRLAERAEPGLLEQDQPRWLNRLDHEWDNLRAALSYFMGESGRTEEVLRMGAALHYFLWTRCQRYGIEVVRAALARPDPVLVAVRARALCRIGDALASTLGWESEGERRAGLALIRQGIELARNLPDPALTSEAALDLAWGAESLGDHDEAARRAAEAVETAQSVGSQRLTGLALGSLGVVATTGPQKRTLWHEAAAHLLRAGDLAMRTIILNSLAVVELEDEQYRPAIDLLEEAIALSDQIGALLHLYWSWGALGEAHLLQGHFEEATACARKALTGFRRLGLRDVAVSHLATVACCAARLGKTKDAAQLFGAYDAMHSAYLRQSATPGRSNRFEKLTHTKQKLHQDNRDSLRQSLGNQDFALVYSAGTRITFDEAVDLALSVTQ
jgi:predicted ATPase/DNA-binding SARP family transcriptional activator